MKIKELIAEDEGVFQKYRRLGQEPIELVKHIGGKLVSGNKPSSPDTKQQSAKVSVPDDGDTKVIVNKALMSQDLDEKEKKKLTAFKNSNTDPETNATLDKVISGRSLDSRDIEILKQLKFQL